VSGLPDGILAYQKYHFGILIVSLGRPWNGQFLNIMIWSSCILYGHLVCSMDIWYVLWTFGLFYGHLVCSMDIWYVLWTFGLFYGHLVCSMDIYIHFMDIWYIQCSFSIFFPVFGILLQENLATLESARPSLPCRKVAAPRSKPCCKK
jgi:hypothetical protein